MKILKYLGIGTMALISIFLGIGLWVTSFEYSSAVSVMAPQEKCWPILHDTSKMKTWMDGLTQTQLDLLKVEIETDDDELD